MNGRPIGGRRGFLLDAFDDGIHGEKRDVRVPRRRTKNDLEYLRGEDRTNLSGIMATTKTRSNEEEEVEVCPPGILKLFMRGDLKWEFRSALGLYMRALETYALLRGKPLLSIVLVKAHHACLSHNTIPSRLVVSPPNYVIIFTLAGP